MSSNNFQPLFSRKREAASVQPRRLRNDATLLNNNTLSIEARSSLRLCIHNIVYLDEVCGEFWIGALVDVELGFLPVNCECMIM